MKGEHHTQALSEIVKRERQKDQVRHARSVRSLVHITAFEEMYLEREDHISVQLCWQPAVGPGVSHHANHIYEQGG